MNRFTDLEAALAQQKMALTDLDRRGLVAVVRDASLAIDTLWRTARAEGKDFTAAELREASQAVHRVLEDLPLA